MSIIKSIFQASLILLVSLSTQASIFDDDAESVYGNKHATVIQDIYPGEVFKISGHMETMFGSLPIAMTVRRLDVGSPPYEILEFSAQGNGWSADKAKLIKLASSRSRLVFRYTKLRPVFLNVELGTSFGINTMDLYDIGSETSDLKITRLAPDIQKSIVNRARPDSRVGEDEVGQNFIRDKGEAKFKYVYIQADDGVHSELNKIVRVTLVEHDGKTYFVEAKSALNPSKTNDVEKLNYYSISSLSVDQRDSSIRIDSNEMFDYSTQTRRGTYDKSGTIKLDFDFKGQLALFDGVRVQRVLRTSTDGRSSIIPSEVGTHIHEVAISAQEAGIRFVSTGLVVPAFIEVASSIIQCGKFYTK